MGRYGLILLCVLGALFLAERCALAGEGTASTARVTEVEARIIVNQAFLEVLGRAPDEGGLSNYTAILIHEGRDQRWLESVLRQSPEGQKINKERNLGSFARDLVWVPVGFSRASDLGLGVALFAMVLSIAVWAGGKRQTLAVFLLLAGVLTMRLFNASLDPFLHLWDERFHALVAKNMMEHPLLPTLHDDPVLDEGVNPGWDRGHIWLHKQPLFLWQIAVAFRLFGVSEFTLRLPSALLATLLVFLVYRLGVIAHGQRVGFLGGFFVGTWHFLGELVSGYQGIDHNDVAFITYVTASLWAWAEYRTATRRTWVWAVAIGLFSGMAILTKWMVGLLVFAPWACDLVTSRRRQALEEIKHFSVALGAALIVAAPWQIYTLRHFPAEALHEIAYSGRHFNEIIEGHGGNAWFHLVNLPRLYGYVASCVLPLGAFYLWRKGNRAIVGALFLSFVAVYAFFSVAETKMPSYPLPVCGAVWLCFAAIVDQVFLVVRRCAGSRGVIWVSEVLTLMLLGYLNLDLAAVERRHSPRVSSSHYRRALVHNKQVFSELSKSLPEGTVLFNVRGRHYVEAMFYTGFPAYNVVPTDAQIRELSKAGRTVAVFSRGPGVQDLLGRPDVRMLSQRLEGYR